MTGAPSTAAELRPPPQLFRLGRRPDPVAWPSPLSLGSPARDRFDDPDRKVRVLYASESEYGCFLEIAARFRPAPGLLQQLRQYGEGEMPATGLIPASEFQQRVLGTFAVSPDAAAGERFLDLRATQTLTHLRDAMAPAAARAGLDPWELERSDAMGRNRRLTQEIARWALSQGYRGLAYESRWAQEVTHWALFHPLELERGPFRAVDPRADPAVDRALSVLGVRLG
ncbi:MAG TPA: RES domain-containing protein [Myxococcales bacterium]|nr:RES domain-containing protein [Myxococcales bacterium]